MMKREELEAALKDGSLFVTMTNGREYRARRNGETKLWKRDADRFSIPFKVGLKVCGRLTEASLVERRPDGTVLVERV